MSPLVLGALGTGAYLIYQKFFNKNIGPSQGNVTSNALGPVVTSASGIKFQAQTVSAFNDGTKIVDVFTTSGARIVRFSQQGSDMNSRVEVISPPGVDQTIKSAAMQAYGIHPKA